MSQPPDVLGTFAAQAAEGDDDAAPPTVLGTFAAALAAERDAAAPDVLGICAAHAAAQGGDDAAAPPPAPAASSGPTVRDALQFMSALNQADKDERAVRVASGELSEYGAYKERTGTGMYPRYLDLMAEFKRGNVDAAGVVARMRLLLEPVPGRDSLLGMFRVFLPADQRHLVDDVDWATPERRLSASQRQGGALPGGSRPTVVTKPLDDQELVRQVRRLVDNKQLGVPMDCEGMQTWEVTLLEGDAGRALLPHLAADATAADDDAAAEQKIDCSDDASGGVGGGVDGGDGSVSFTLSDAVTALARFKPCFADDTVSTCLQSAVSDGTIGADGFSLTTMLDAKCDDNADNDIIALYNLLANSCTRLHHITATRGCFGFHDGPESEDECDLAHPEPAMRAADRLLHAHVCFGLVYVIGATRAGNVIVLAVEGFNY